MSGVWAELARTLRSSVPYRRLRDELGDVVRLPPPAAAWVGELLGRDLGRPLLVLVPHEADALAWLEAARLFAGEERGALLPRPQPHPYQEGGASLPVRAQEVVALDRLLRSGAGAAAPRRCSPRRGRSSSGCPGGRAFRRRVLELRAGRGLAARAARRAPRRGGLPARRPRHPGGRGGGARRRARRLAAGRAELPLRLDLFGDTLESVRAFDPVSQRSGEALPRRGCCR